MHKIKSMKMLNKKYMLHFFVLFVTILTCSMIYSSTLSYEVKIDGKNIGIVENKREVYRLVEDMKNQIKKEFNKDVTIGQNITFNKVRVGKDQLTSKDVFKENLGKVIDLKVKAYAIQVNGKDIVFLKDKKEAEQVLKEIKNVNIKETQGKEIKEIKFMEKVSIKEKEANVAHVKNEKNAYNYLINGSESIQKYIVKDGDTIWDIAKAHDLKVEDIQKANPDINIDKLKIDQKINITAAKPYVNVKVIELASYEEVIPYETLFEDTQALYKGEKKVKLQGLEGKKKIEAEIVKINGVETGKNILAEEILQVPENKVVLQGTKNKPTTMAFGVFANPTRGKLSSRFGKRWGKSHTGVDIAAPKGTDIKSADGGTVIFSGTQNGYGKLVIVDHGNGYKTYYGHCSELDVKKGEKVAQGQVIAKVGSTGRSTGNHLHFEVRIKDKPVNPLQYVKY